MKKPNTNMSWEEQIDKILNSCVLECNDGPTPWCFDSNCSNPYQYRNQILGLIKQSQSNLIDQVIEWLDSNRPKNARREDHWINVHSLVDYLQGLKENHG